MEDQSQIVARLYDYFYYKVYKNAYKLDLTSRNLIKIHNYLKRLSNHYSIHSLGLSFFFEYFCFAFEYWSNKQTKRRITLDWIIGPRMINRWIERPPSAQYYNHKFIKECDLSVEHVIEDLVHEDNDGLDPAEELEKIRHKKNPLYHCLFFTTLFNHKSSCCVMCTQRDECKKLLKRTRPHLYKRRGYESSVR